MSAATLSFRTGSCALITCALFSVRSAHADAPNEGETSADDAGVQIDRPHEGPRPIEVEAMFGAIWYGPGLSVGARVNLPLMPNGFVPDINNAVYLSLGLDLYYGSYRDGLDQKEAGFGFGVPVALHWSFYFTEAWSAFAELGVNAYFPPVFLSGGDLVDRIGGWVLAQIGGRWHPSESFALTVRLGTPSATLGGALFF